MELPILQSQLGICDWARQFKCQRRAWCERRNRQVACLLRPSRSGYYCHGEIQCARWKRLLQLQSPLGRDGPIRSVAFEINDLTDDITAGHGSDHPGEVERGDSYRPDGDSIQNQFLDFCLPRTIPSERDAILATILPPLGDIGLQKPFGHDWFGDSSHVDLLHVAFKRHWTKKGPGGGANRSGGFAGPGGTASGKLNERIHGFLSHE